MSNNTGNASEFPLSIRIAELDRDNAALREQVEALKTENAPLYSDRIAALEGRAEKAERERDEARKWANCGGPPTGKMCLIDGHAIYGAFVTSDTDKEAAICELHFFQRKISELEQALAVERDRVKRLREALELMRTTALLRGWAVCSLQYVREVYEQACFILRDTAEPAPGVAG